jgi:hypothetical protein
MISDFFAAKRLIISGRCDAGNIILYFKQINVIGYLPFSAFVVLNVRLYNLQIRAVVLSA